MNNSTDDTAPDSPPATDSTDTKPGWGDGFPPPEVLALFPPIEGQEPQPESPAPEPDTAAETTANAGVVEPSPLTERIPPIELAVAQLPRSDDDYLAALAREAAMTPVPIAAPPPPVEIHAMQPMEPTHWPGAPVDAGAPALAKIAIPPEQPAASHPAPDQSYPALKIYMIAGEASGDLIGGHLMQSLKRNIKHPLLFHGVGGDRMIAEGLPSLFPYNELSLLGVVELLPYLLKIFSRINLVVDDILNKRPDIVITIDSPGFSFRVVEKLRAEGYTGKCVHYVAPTVWAYKPKRAEYCAKLYDHMLVLMEFEKPYFDQAGLSCTWVGHPVVVETQTGNARDFRQKYSISDSTTLFCLLPGSRKNEIQRHMPVFAKAIMILAPYYPDLAIVVAVPKNMMEHIGPYFANCPFRAVVTSNEQDKKDAIAAGNIAFVKSGTVALEAAMAGTPMLIAYSIHALSAWWFKRQSLIRHVNLINIIQKREVFPELLQENCNALMVATAATALLEDTGRQQEQREQTQQALQQFIPPHKENPSDIASRSIIRIMGLEAAAKTA